MHKRHDFRKPCLYTLVFLLLISIIVVPSFTNAYNCKSGDTECEEAKQNMLDNQKTANTYIAKANSVSEIIDQLNSEIDALNAQIAENENEIKTLKVQIEKTETKLNEDRNALAKMLIDMHFEDNSEPIRILAGSKSISDLAEKQAREDVVKQQIAATSEKIKQEKEELDAKKISVEAKLSENQANKNNVASKRAEQEALKQQYEQNADEASVVASYWENLLQKLAYTPPSNTTGWGTRNYYAVNTYDERYNCPGSNMSYYTFYGGAVCQCTSYVSWKAYEKWGIINTWNGHAYNYVNAIGYYVPNSGIRTYVNREAAANTIAVKTDGDYGHVMWVESINNDGTINVTEYNVTWPSAGCYAGGFCARDHVGTADTYFVHFEY